MNVDDILKAQKEKQSKMKLTKEDVWGKYDDKAHKLSNGMIIARGEEKCPIFKDKLPYKSVTVVCKPEEEEEVCYWLDYVHGGGISKRKVLEDGKIAIRSNYMCW
jgi:hypothetical protein